MLKPPEPCPNRLPVIGLLGAPGSGKSTVARMFAAEGCAVIDADQLSREAFEDAMIRATLVRWWGAAVAPAGKIDRQQIASVVFNDPEQRKRLEGLIHPYVKRRRAERHESLQGTAPGTLRAIVEDSPLLIESGLDRDCDALVFIDCPLAVRQERVMASRGWSPEQLAAREAAQAPLDTKRARSDYTIANVGDAGAIHSRVRDVLQSILQAFVPGRASRAPRI